MTNSRLLRAVMALGLAINPGTPHLQAQEELEELADHYQEFLKRVANPVILTDGDKADMVAYLKLLD